MSLLSFPDINVWLALATSEHIHSPVAHRWWDSVEGTIAFSRMTQTGFLRVMTTAAAMHGRPLTMDEAWRVYDRLYADSRVAFLPEPAGIEAKFREHTRARTASPKVWGDAWLLAFAESSGGTVVTLDRALAARGAYCLLEDERS